MEHIFIKYLYRYMFRPNGVVIMLAFRTYCGSKVYISHRYIYNYILSLTL